jgi:hypothetical protein
MEWIDLAQGRYREIFLADDLLASQKGLCCMELFS